MSPIKFHRWFVMPLCSAVLLAGMTAPLDAETATLKGKFVLDGKAPAVEKIVPTQDAEACGKHNLVREELVVGADGGIANVCIWAPKLKPQAGAAAPPPAVLDNLNCRFDPRIVTMQAGQVLTLKNSDPVAHNTKGEPKLTKPFNQLIPAKGSHDIKTLTKAESRPIQVACNIHSWMKGWIIVAEGPFAATSKEDGSFEITGLPAGTPIEFQVWQERGGYVKDVTVGGKKTVWTMGKFKMTLKPGENDLGTIQAKIGG